MSKSDSFPHLHEVNARDIEEKLLHAISRLEPNCTFVWSGNVGVVLKKSGLDAVKHRHSMSSAVNKKQVIIELEMCLKKLLGKMVKVICDE